MSDNDELVSTQITGLNITAMAIVATLVYRLVLYYVESTTGLDFKLWDVKTCTPADFTVQIKITDAMN